MLARRVLVTLPFLVPFALLAQAAFETPAERPRYKSPLGLAVDAKGRFAYVALHTADALAVVDLHKGQVVCEIPVGKKPYDVAFRQGFAYVTCEADDTLVVVDVAKKKVDRVFKVPQSPRGVSVNPGDGFIQVVCHDANVLWQQRFARSVPIPPQPEGNFARASSPKLDVEGDGSYLLSPRPFDLFMRGKSSGPNISLRVGSPDPRRTAFNPMIDLDYAQSNMDLVAHTRPLWFIPTAQAPQGRIFTNAFSFFISKSKPAAVVLLDEPDKGYPDPTDVIVKLPKRAAGKPAPMELGADADTHPLKGAKVFISSGGADTVVVLDFHKAAKHAEANPMIGGFGGMMGGPMQFGGWGMMGGNMISGGNMMSGGMMSGYGMSGGMMMQGGMMNNGLPRGNMVGGGMSGIGSMGVWGGGFSGFHIGGNPFGGKPGMPVATVPSLPILPAVGMPGVAAVALLASSTPAGPMMGMQGGFPENLHASANYTIARLPTQANPRRMVLTPDGKTLVISNHLADSLTLIDTEKLQVVRHIDLGGPAPDVARRGEILFHSAKHTIQQQFTCASCHPNNGSDGLSWNTSPDGKGEWLNTRALHGVRDTYPFGWKGESETLEERAKNTMRDVHKHKLSDADASAIAAYLKTLDPLRPLPPKFAKDPAIVRGKALFFGKANCIRCHRGDAYTSDSPRAVILDQEQKLTPFDVPSLRGVARTAPYLHDGRAATLEEIFEQHNPMKRHGLAALNSRVQS